jgi:hypothetical protein
MLQARTLNKDYYFIEQGTACRSFCFANCISHVELDDTSTQRTFNLMHVAFPELKKMQAEFTFAYARMFHMYEVALQIGAESFAFNDGDSMPYTSASHLNGHFADAGIEVAYCTYWPRANNLFSIFTQRSLRDMIKFAAITVSEGRSYGSPGDMAWILSYAAAGFSKEQLECYANDGVERGSDSRLKGKCKYSQFYMPKSRDAKPKFTVGNTCRAWDNGVGSDAIQVDREQIYETYGPKSTHKRVVWLRGFPHFVRKDTHQFERAWHIHFQGEQKKYQKNYLRRYDT